MAHEKGQFTIDQSVLGTALEERIARTTSPRQRAMLETLLAHNNAEIAGDLDAVMATLGEEPAYCFWSDGRDIGPKGREQIAGFYTSLVRSAAFVLEANLERLVVDDENIVTELRVRQLLPGASARANGYAVEDDGFYVIEFRTILLWAYEADGKLIGEDSYLSRNLTDIHKIDDDEVPPNLRELFETSDDARYVFT